MVLRDPVDPSSIIVSDPFEDIIEDDQNDVDIDSHYTMTTLSNPLVSNAKPTSPSSSADFESTVTRNSAPISTHAARCSRHKLGDLSEEACHQACSDCRQGRDGGTNKGTPHTVPKTVSKGLTQISGSTPRQRTGDGGYVSSHE